MGGGVDAARETRHDAEAGGAKVAGEALGHLHSRGRSVARADHGDEGAVQHRGIAADREEGRGVVDDLEMRWIVGLAERDETGAQARGGRDLLRGLLAAADTQRPPRAPPRRARLRQRRERRPGAATVIDEGAERPAGGVASRSRAASGISLPALRTGPRGARWTGTGEGG